MDYCALFSQSRSRENRQKTPDFCSGICADPFAHTGGRITGFFFFVAPCGFCVALTLTKSGFHFRTRILRLSSAGAEIPTQHDRDEKKRRNTIRCVSSAFGLLPVFEKVIKGCVERFLQTLLHHRKYEVLQLAFTLFPLLILVLFILCLHC